MLPKNKKILAPFSVVLGCRLLSTVVAVGVLTLLVHPLLAQETEEIDQLSGAIEQKRQNINTLEQEIRAFRENITAKQAEARGLNNQLSILQNQIALLELDIQATETRIEQTNLEIQRLNLQIRETESQISQHKDRMAQYIQLINLDDQVSYLEVMLTHPRFSDFFDQLQYTQQIYGNLRDSLNKFKDAKRELEVQRQNWEQKIKQEQDFKDELLKQKTEIGERSVAQQVLLVQTRLTEKQYQQNLHQLQLEQQQANADILSLEKKVREALEDKDRDDFLRSQGPAEFDWPVSPSRGVSAFFHDPDYPFRYIFEHPAIDIRAGQGTQIKAPSAGYVARVKFDGSSKYSYIMLVHNSGFSTVYGHISSPLVQEEQLVTKGQVIALSGGLPGTPGSGPLTTGPHLHFEVRLDGIPVDPLQFLPGF